MAILFSLFAYLLMTACYLGAFLLVMEWLVHQLPGSGLNPLRRWLFQASFPLLRWDSWFVPARFLGGRWRGLLTSSILFAIGHYIVPGLILFSFSLRG